MCIRDSCYAVHIKATRRAAVMGWAGGDTRSVKNIDNNARDRTPRPPSHKHTIANETPATEARQLNR
eukprot:3727756-Pyramimonas_sp.AAC.1